MARLGIQLRGTSRLLKGVESGTKEVTRSKHGIGGFIVKKAGKLFKKKDGLSIDEKLKMVKSGDLDKATGLPNYNVLDKKEMKVFDEGFGSKQSRLKKIFNRSTELLEGEADKYKRMKKISPDIKSVKPNVPKTKIQKMISNTKIEMAKIKNQVSNKYKPQMEMLDKELIKVNQSLQKLKGEKVTKSGISKGKNKK